jgi:hypothetical protein
MLQAFSDVLTVEKLILHDPAHGIRICTIKIRGLLIAPKGPPHPLLQAGFVRNDIKQMTKRGF